MSFKCYFLRNTSLKTYAVVWWGTLKELWCIKSYLNISVDPRINVSFVFLLFSIWLILLLQGSLWCALSIKSMLLFWIPFLSIILQNPMILDEVWSHLLTSSSSSHLVIRYSLTAPVTFFVPILKNNCPNHSCDKINPHVMRCMTAPTTFDFR